jgi:hypothetical protein
VASERGSGSKPPLPPAIENFGASNEAAVAEYGKKLGALDLEQLEDEPEPAEVRPPASRPEQRPNLEPVGDDAHPPQNRRIPTQPGLMLAFDDEPPKRRREPSPAEEPEREAADQRKPVPPPPAIGPRHSPAPVRRGLFSSDRITNLLAGAAIGLLIMILPAKRFAASYEEREVEPRLADLRGVIEHPLGVEAGLVEHPDKIAAEIHAGRRKVRRRFMALWLLVGLPIGLGIGLLPRPGD